MFQRVGRVIQLVSAAGIGGKLETVKCGTVLRGEARRRGTFSNSSVCRLRSRQTDVRLLRFNLFACVSLERTGKLMKLLEARLGVNRAHSSQSGRSPLPRITSNPRPGNGLG